MPEPVTRFLRSLDPGPADADLLRRFAESQDQTAFELLVWRHAAMTQAAAFAVLRDRHLAEDAAQAAFLALARRAGSVRTNPSGWLYRTARRAALGMRCPVGPAVPDVPAPDVRHSRTYDDLAALHDELARLPDRYRLPVLLCLVEGLTHPAAAARLGWPVGTVAGRLSRAKALLRDRLTRRGVTAGLTLAPAVGGGWVSATATAATTFAAGGLALVSPTVLLTAKGLVRVMIVTKLQWAVGLVALAGVVAGGGLWATAQGPGDGPGPAVPPPAAARPAPPTPIPAERVTQELNGKTVTVDLFVRRVQAWVRTPEGKVVSPPDLSLSSRVSLDNDDTVQVLLTGAARPETIVNPAGEVTLKDVDGLTRRYQRRTVRVTGKLTSTLYLTFPAHAVHQLVIDDPKNLVVLDPFQTDPARLAEAATEAAGLLDELRQVVGQVKTVEEATEMNRALRRSIDQLKSLPAK